MIVLTLLILIALIFISSKIHSKHTRSAFIFMGWLFYTFVFAFYSGAQTMYLSVEKEIEIEKSIDVLRSQNWDLLIVRGYETFVNFYARQGFEEFKSLENDIANGYAHYYDSVEVSSGLD